VELQTALQALYGHYARTFDVWKQEGIQVPPCFIVVCNNTATSKLVYDYISGFVRENDDGTTAVVNGRLALFRNFDADNRPLARPFIPGPYPGLPAPFLPDRSLKKASG
jgi:type III restriction enzyme